MGKIHRNNRLMKGIILSLVLFVTACHKKAEQPIVLTTEERLPVIVDSIFKARGEGLGKIALTDISRLKVSDSVKTFQITTLIKKVNALQDSLALYKGYLAQPDFLIDKNRIISIPMLQKIPLLEARVIKLEPKQ